MATSLINEPRYIDKKTYHYRHWAEQGGTIMKSNNRDKHEKNFSDKLAEVAREAEKDPARKKIDPLENYDIEGPDVREVDATPIVPIGNPVPGFETQHHAGEVAAVAPIIDRSDEHLSEEEALAIERREGLEEADEEVIPLRPDGTMDPRSDLDPFPEDLDGTPRSLSEDEFGVERPLHSHHRPVGADDVDERPLIERIADAFDGNEEPPSYTRVDDLLEEEIDELKAEAPIGEPRYPITDEEVERANNPGPDYEIDDVEHPLRRAALDEGLPPHAADDDKLFAPFVDPLPDQIMEDEEEYDDLEYDDEFFEEDEKRKGPR